MASRRFDVVFVGGGVIGLSAAWEAAAHGLTACVVDSAPGHGATWVAAGMLAPVTEAEASEEALTRLLVAAAARWSEFADRLGADVGGDVGFRPQGTVVVGLDASDRAVVDRLLDLHRRLGLHSERLSSSACRAAVPPLSPAVRGGAAVAGDHQVDNRRLVRALLDACAVRGVQFVADRVEAVVTGRAGRIDGVRTAGGEDVAAGAVVVAAGVGSGRLGGVPTGVLPPVRPIKGHILRLRDPSGRRVLPCTLRAVVRGRASYLVPRDDGSVVVGATAEERGYDVTVQAGAVHALLDDARALVPAVDELVLEESAAGLRPAAPDNGPVVGWTGVPGLAVATGHFRNGILLAPLTAQVLAGLLCGSGDAGSLAGWGPERFAGPGMPRGALGATTAPAGVRPGAGGRP